MHMQDALAQRSDPQTALAVPEQPIRNELPTSRKGIGRGFPVDELSDSALHGDPECAVVAFDQGRNAAYRVWVRIEFWSIRLPAPQAIRRSHPEIALIFI